MLLQDHQLNKEDITLLLSLTSESLHSVQFKRLQRERFQHMLFEYSEHKQTFQIIAQIIIFINDYSNILDPIRLILFNNHLDLFDTSTILLINDNNIEFEYDISILPSAQNQLFADGLSKNNSLYFKIDKEILKTVLYILNLYQDIIPNKHNINQRILPYQRNTWQYDIFFSLLKNQRMTLYEQIAIYCILALMMLIIMSLPIISLLIPFIFK